MSWMYMKKGLINDSETGPLSDEALLQLAFDGDLTPKTLVFHPTNTGGQWMPLNQIPLALKRCQEGEQLRATESAAALEVKRVAAEQARAAKQAEKESRALIAQEKQKLKQETQLAQRASHREMPTSKLPFAHMLPGYREPPTIIVNSVPTHSHAAPQQTIIVTQGRQSQAIPALVNLLCFPGMGQLIQGRPLAAIFWWSAHLLSALSLGIGIGFIIWPIVWILCVADAAMYTPR